MVLYSTALIFTIIAQYSNVISVGDTDPDPSVIKQKK